MTHFVYYRYTAPKTSCDHLYHQAFLDFPTHLLMLLFENGKHHEMNLD